MSHNWSLCFTKGMGEIKKYCIYSLTLDFKPQKYALHNKALFLLSLNQRMHGAERRSFCTCFLHCRREQSRKNKADSPQIKADSIRHLQEHITPTASVTACDIYWKSIKHTLQHISSNSLEACQQHTWTTASKWRWCVRHKSIWQCFLLKVMVELNSKIMES